MTTTESVIKLRGYRSRDVDLLAEVWRGDDLLSSTSTPPWPVGLPTAGRSTILLVAPSHGVVYFDLVEYVHRRATLTVAAVHDEQRPPLLAAAMDVAANRLNLHRVFGYLPVGRTNDERIVTSCGFRADLVIPEHGLANGLPVARTVWGWLA